MNNKYNLKYQELSNFNDKTKFEDESGLIYQLRDNIIYNIEPKIIKVFSGSEKFRVIN